MRAEALWERGMSSIDISQLLNQMRVMSAQAQDGLSAATAASPETMRQDFASLLQDSVSKVNETQQSAGKLAAAFEAEDPNVDLAQVMIALQKANVSFQALTQVRNKLVSAYQEIMNMQV
jgi:flagellar hook-basal body complex protein FliE